MRALIDTAGAGNGGLGLVEGDAGVGKTSLLTAVLREAGDDGFRVLRAHSSELEQQVALGVVRQLLSPAVERADAGERVLLFDGAAGAARSLLWGGTPEGPREGRTDDRPEGPPSPDAEFATLHALYWLLANLAEQGPLLIVVDDAHWADLPSLRFLSLLAPRLPELAVAVVVASRPTERALTGDLLAQLERDAGGPRLRLAGLGEASVAAIVRAGLGGGDPEFCQACHAAAGGNPFYLGEMLRELRSAGVDPTAASASSVAGLAPRSVGRIVLMRLARLPAGAVELARAVSVLGDGVELRLAAGLAGLDIEPAARVADALIDAAIFGPAQQLAFAHPIARNAVYADIGPRQRAAEHGRVARLLAAEHAPVDRVGPHLLAADPAGDQWVVEALRASASEAYDRGAPDLAARFLVRAAAEPPDSSTRAAVLTDLGLAERQIGDAAAVEHLTAALASSADPATTASSACALGWMALFAGEVEGAAAILEQALASVGRQSEAGERIAGELVDCAFGSRAGRRRFAGLVAGLTDPGGIPASPFALHAVAALAYDAVVDGGDARLAVDRATRALASLEASAADPRDSGFPAGIAVVALAIAEGFTEAETAATGLLDAAHRRASALAIVGWLAIRSMVRYRGGAVADAEIDAADALELGRRLPWAEPLLTIAAAYAIPSALERARGQAEIDELIAFGQRLDPDPLVRSHVLIAHGQALAARCEHARAVEQFVACDHDEPGWGRDCPSAVPWRSAAALSLSALGRGPEARQLAADEVRLARAAAAMPRALGVALRAGVGDVNRIPGGRAALHGLCF